MVTMPCDEGLYLATTMNSPQIEQKATGAISQPAELAPGDDGFQSLSTRFRGRILSGEDLNALHQARLMREFLEGLSGQPNEDSR